MSPGLSALKRADCKSPEKESLRLRSPLSSPFPSLQCEGPSSSPDSGKGPERREKWEEADWRRGGCTPPKGFSEPICLLRFWSIPPKRRTACPLLEAEIGPKSEAWRGCSDTLTVEGGRSQECFCLWPPPPPTSSSWGFVRLPTGSLTTSAPSCSLINRLLELGFCLRRLRRGLLAARLLWQADSWLAHLTPISRKGKYR